MIEKRGYYKSKEILKFAIVVSVSLCALMIIYYVFLYTETCKSEDCFITSLTKCRKARWINDAEEAIWLYTIKGISERSCEVEVKSLSIKKGKLDIGEAESKSMTCYLPLGTVSSPEEDLNRCTGELKEELQELIIKRIHSYVLENLGEISKEVTSPL